MTETTAKKLKSATSKLADLRDAAFEAERPRLERLFDEVRQRCTGMGPLDYVLEMDSGWDDDDEFEVDPNGWTLHVHPATCLAKGGDWEGKEIYQSYDVCVDGVMELLDYSQDKHHMHFDTGLKDAQLSISGMWEGRPVYVVLHAKPSEHAPPTFTVTDKGVFEEIDYDE